MNDFGVYISWQLDAKVVEICAEAVDVMVLDSMDVVCVLMGGVLRVVVFVSDLRGEGVICGREAMMGAVDIG